MNIQVGVICTAHYTDYCHYHHYTMLIPTPLVHNDYFHSPNTFSDIKLHEEFLRQLRSIIFVIAWIRNYST